MLECIPTDATVVALRIHMVPVQPGEALMFGFRAMCDRIHRIAALDRIDKGYSTLLMYSASTEIPNGALMYSASTNMTNVVFS